MKPLISLAAFVAATSLAQAAEPELSLTQMLEVKQRLTEADTFLSQRQSGIALLHIIEAEHLAGTSFQEYIAPKKEEILRVAKDRIDIYSINVVVKDLTNSGKAQEVRSSLLDRKYVSGLEMTSAGAPYTFTVVIHSLDLEEKTSTLSHIIQIPTGTNRTTNGAYVAKQSELSVRCQEYMQEKQAARGSELRAARYGIAAMTESSGSLLDTALNLAEMMNEGANMSSRDAAHANCESAMQDLEATPMFTQEVVTTPFSYDEKTTMKTAIASVSFSFAGQGLLDDSSPFEVRYFMRDFSRPSIDSVGIRGDPEEPISDRDVRAGVFNEISDLIFKRINDGASLWDVAALHEAQKKSGNAALEAYVQLALDAYSKSIRSRALEYVAAHSSVSADQLTKYTK